MGRMGHGRRDRGRDRCRLALLAPRVRADVDNYEVYAVRYATLANFPVSSLVAGADRARRLDIAMMIWVLKGIDGRIAIVDSGFHRDRYFTPVHGQGLHQAVRGDRAARHQAGGRHRHPADAHALGPCRRRRSVSAARVWVQKDEYDYYTGDAWQSRTHPRRHRCGRCAGDREAEHAGKVSFVRGDDDTSLSGITFGIGGKHTWASQFVTVQTRPQTVVHRLRQHVSLRKPGHAHADRPDARRRVQPAGRRIG